MTSTNTNIFPKNIYTPLSECPLFMRVYGCLFFNKYTAKESSVKNNNKVSNVKKNQDEHLSIREWAYQKMSSDSKFSATNLTLLDILSAGKKGKNWFLSLSYNTNDFEKILAQRIFLDTDSTELLGVNLSSMGLEEDFKKNSFDIDVFYRNSLIEDIKDEKISVNQLKSTYGTEMDPASTLTKSWGWNPLKFFTNVSNDATSWTTFVFIMKLLFETYKLTSRNNLIKDACSSRITLNYQIEITDKLPSSYLSMFAISFKELCRIISNKYNLRSTIMTDADVVLPPYSIQIKSINRSTDNLPMLYFVEVSFDKSNESFVNRIIEETSNCIISSSTSNVLFQWLFTNKSFTQMTTTMDKPTVHVVYLGHTSVVYDSDTADVINMYCPVKGDSKQNSALANQIVGNETYTDDVEKAKKIIKQYNDTLVVLKEKFEKSNPALYQEKVKKLNEMLSSQMQEFKRTKIVVDNVEGKISIRHAPNSEYMTPLVKYNLNSSTNLISDSMRPLINIS